MTDTRFITYIINWCKVPDSHLRLNDRRETLYGTRWEITRAYVGSRLRSDRLSHAI